MRDLDHEMTKLLADGVKAIEVAITKIKLRLDHGQHWTTDETKNLYTTIYDMCCEMKSWDSTSHENYVVKRIYNTYDTALQERILEKVFPSLENKEGTPLLTELLEEWSQYKDFAKHLLIMFHHLKNYSHVSSYTEVWKTSFCDLIWKAFCSNIDKALSHLMIHPRAFDENCPITDDASKSLLPRDLANFFVEVENVSNEKLQITRELWSIKIFLSHLRKE